MDKYLKPPFAKPPFRLSRTFTFGRGEKAPTPTLSASVRKQLDLLRANPVLLRAPGGFTTRHFPVYFTTKWPFIRPIEVLSKDEIGP